MIVQHNLVSMFTNRQLGITTGNKAKSSEKLGSGYRINRSADDAAGLSISEKMRSQVRGLHRASQNLEDGISYVQTADGALSQVSDMLQRMRELAVQASNIAVNDEDDRQKIQDEISELRSEVNQVFLETEFNKKKIWDETRATGGLIQVGSHTEPAVRFPSASVSGTITNENRGAFPYSYTSNGYGSGSFLVSADEDNGIKVSWTALNGNTYSTSNIPWPEGGIKSANSFHIKDYLDTDSHPELVGVDAVLSYSPHELSTESDVLSALNSTSIGCTYYNTERAQMFSSGGSTSVSGVSSPSVSINYLAALASDRDFNSADTGYICANPSNTNNMTIPSSDSDPWTFSFVMDGIGPVTAKSTSMTYVSSDRRDETLNLWWHYGTKYDRELKRYVTDYNSKLQSTVYPEPNNGTLGAFKYIMNNTDGKNVFTDSNGTGTITVNFALTSATPYSYGGKSSSSVGSMSFTVSYNRSDTLDSVLAKINSIGGIDIYNANSSGNTDVGTASKMSYSSSRSSYNSGSVTIPEYESTGMIEEYIQAGANELQGIDLTYRYLSARVLGINDVSVDTFEHAQEALTKTDNALMMVSEERSRFGAYQNRFEYAQKYDDIAEENLADAESRIRDTDMAEEMARFSKENILEQAGISMLTQANQQGQQVLSLLQ